MSVLQYLDAPNVRVSNFHPTNEDIRELGTWPLAVLKQLGCYEYLSGEDWQLLLLPQSWLAAVPEGHNMFVLGEGESPFSRKEAEEFPPILGISPWGIIRGNLDNALPELSIDKTADAAVNMVRTMWASFIRGVMDKEGVDKAVILVLQFVSGVISTRATTTKMRSWPCWYSTYLSRQRRSPNSPKIIWTRTGLKIQLSSSYLRTHALYLSNTAGRLQRKRRIGRRNWRLRTMDKPKLKVCHYEGQTMLCSTQFVIHVPEEREILPKLGEIVLEYFKDLKPQITMEEFAERIHVTRLDPPIIYRWDEEKEEWT